MIHVSNNFISSKVHSELVKAISNDGGSQVVLVPIRTSEHLSKNSEGLRNVELKYILFKNKLVRFFPLLKVFYVFLKSFKALMRAIDESYKLEGRSDVIAHNFWSDGMVVFLASFFRRFRYVLVVRNTDMNYFISKLPHYRWLMQWAIRRSSGVIFISQAHYLRFKASWPRLAASACKVKIIPNALSDYWLNNIVMESLVRPNQACFVGRFDRNKNLATLVRAATGVHRSFPDFKLLLVGGTQDDFIKTTGFQEVPSFVEILGTATNDELRDVYRSSRLFVMPSFTETFGLVYVEALSQGCAVICSKGEGIDGMWNQPFIRAVNPKSEFHLEEEMRALLFAYCDGIPGSWIAEEITRFSWKRAASQYLEFFL